MPSFFFRCSGVYPGEGGAGVKCKKLMWCKVFFAFHLILSGKLHICGRDNLFFLLFKFAF